MASLRFRCWSRNLQGVGVWLVSVSLLGVLHSAVRSDSLAAPSRALHPFTVGERLTYRLSWLGVTAGTAALGVEGAESIQERPIIKLVTTARSSPWITRFYPVDNRVESWVDAESLVPQRMTFHRREGKRKNDFEYRFHHEQGKVSVVKDGQPAELEIPAGTQDALSCLYFARAFVPLIPGQAVVLNVHHDKKTYKLELLVEGIDHLEGPWGKQEAVRVLAVMPFQGIFLNEGNVRVWFSNDDRRIPLMMKAKVIIGSVVADLVEGFGPAGLSSGAT
ncbi:MAG: DUF3108 domain-containing protein [Nitrospiraceae bacterium]